MSPSLDLYKNGVLDRGETVSLSNLSTEQWLLLWPVECDLHFRPGRQGMFNKFKTGGAYNRFKTREKSHELFGCLRVCSLEFDLGMAWLFVLNTLPYHMLPSPVVTCFIYFVSMHVNLGKSKTSKEDRGREGETFTEKPQLLWNNFIYKHWILFL